MDKINCESFFIPEYAHFKTDDLEKLYSIYTIALLGDEISEVKRREVVCKMTKIREELDKRKVLSIF